MNDHSVAAQDDTVRTVLQWRTDVLNAPRDRTDIFIALKPKRPGSPRRHDYAVAFWTAGRGWLGLNGVPVHDRDIAFWAEIPAPGGGGS